jgi:hypothetical protein
MSRVGSLEPHVLAFLTERGLPSWWLACRLDKRLHVPLLADQLNRKCVSASCGAGSLVLSNLKPEAI